MAGTTPPASRSPPTVASAPAALRVGRFSYRHPQHRPRHELRQLRPRCGQRQIPQPTNETTSAYREACRGRSDRRAAPAGSRPATLRAHGRTGGGEVQRGYLLNLRVKVPPAQVPVWRRSHIRQLTGATLTAESPDVNVLKRGRETPDQPGRQAIRRAVARANGLIAEIPPSVELVAGYSECQAFPSPTRWPVLVRKELGRARIRLPAEVEGGNSEQLSRESPEGVLLRQDDPGMPRTGPITAGWREVERRAADWRMRPASEDGRDNTTRLERGPQGSGGASGSALPGH